MDRPDLLTLIIRSIYWPFAVERRWDVSADGDYYRPLNDEDELRGNAHGLGGEDNRGDDIDWRATCEQLHEKLQLHSQRADEQRLQLIKLIQLQPNSPVSIILTVLPFPSNSG